MNDPEVMERIASALERIGRLMRIWMEDLGELE